MPDLTVHPWSLEIGPALADVWTAGYPHALDIAEEGYVAQRAFKGHIVSHVPHKRLPDQSFLDVYELSFMAPKGISGAPLLLNTSSAVVIGVILGMRQTDMNVEREMEASDDGKTVEFHWYIQRMTYGIALTSQAIGKIQSSILTMTIGEFLQKAGLVAASSS